MSYPDFDRPVFLPLEEPEEHPLLRDCWPGRDWCGDCRVCGRKPRHGHPAYCPGPIQLVDRIRMMRPAWQFLAAVGRTVASLRENPTVARGMMIELR